MERARTEKAARLAMSLCLQICTTSNVMFFNFESEATASYGIAIPALARDSPLLTSHLVLCDLTIHSWRHSL